MNKTEGRANNGVEKEMILRSKLLKLEEMEAGGVVIYSRVSAMTVPMWSREGQGR